MWVIHRGQWVYLFSHFFCLNCSLELTVKLHNFQSNRSPEWNRGINSDETDNIFSLKYWHVNAKKPRLKINLVNYMFKIIKTFLQHDGRIWVFMTRALYWLQINSKVYNTEMTSNTTESVYFKYTRGTEKLGGGSTFLKPVAHLVIMCISYLYYYIII